MEVIPNYPADLNAMHEVITSRTEREISAINAELMMMLGSHLALDLAINSTALQRAEAFCRVFWPERFKT